MRLGLPGRSARHGEAESPRYRALRGTVWGYAGALAVLVGIATTALAWHDRDETLETARQMAETRAAAWQAHVRSVLDRARHRLALVARSGPFPRPDLVLGGGVTQYAVADTTGELVAHNHQADAPHAPDPRAVLKKSTGGGLRLGAPVAAGDRRLLPLVRSRTDGGKVAVFIDMAVLKAFTTRVNLAPGDRLRLEQPDGTVHARLVRGARARVAPGGARAGQAPESNGDHLVVRRSVPDYPVVAATGLALGPAMQGWRARLAFYAAIVLGSLLVIGSLGGRLVNQLRASEAAEGRVREQERAARGILEATSQGWARLAPDGTVRAANSALRGLLGGDPVGRTLAGFAAADHAATLPDQLRALARDGKAVVSARLVTADGDVRHVEGQGGALAEGDDAGDTFVFLTDVTESRAAEQALAESEERFRQFTRAAFEGLMLVEDGRVIDANPALCRMLGVSLETMTGRPMTDLMDTDDAARACCDMETETDGPCEITLQRADGTTLPAEVRGRAFHYRGRLVHAYAVQDITERKEAEARLKRLASVDALTNCLNRRAFFEAAEREFERHQRHGHAIAAVMVDADHFKALNDSWGHQAGDTVLLEIARRIRDSVRTNDVVGRYGGEEFAILLPDTDAEGAHELAERLRRTVAAAPVYCDDQPVPCTVSVGCAGATALNDMDSLLSRADDALYRAKAAGRDRTVCDALDPA